MESDLTFYIDVICKADPSKCYIGSLLKLIKGIGRLPST